MAARELYQRIVKDLAKTIVLDVVKEGKIISPDAATATISITIASSGVALTTPVSGAAATIAASGQLQYAVTAGNTDIEAQYKAEWKYQIGGVDHTQDSFYRVVKSVSDMLVTKEDLNHELPKLANANFEDVTWPDFIDARWSKTQREARKRGIYDWLILRDEDLYYAHLYMIVRDAALSLSEKEDDTWDLLHKEYKKIVSDEWNRLVVAYDSNNDNKLDEQENVRGFNQIRLNR